MVPERMSLMGPRPCTYTSDEMVRIAGGRTRGLGDSPPREVIYEPMRGEDLPQSKLTEKQVREIRRRYDARSETLREIAAAFGTSRPNICTIGQRRSWRHVTEEVA